MTHGVIYSNGDDNRQNPESWMARILNINSLQKYIIPHSFNIKTIGRQTKYFTNKITANFLQYPFVITCLATELIQKQVFTNDYNRISCDILLSLNEWMHPWYKSSTTTHYNHIKIIIASEILNKLPDLTPNSHDELKKSH
jgi:hypothetical protein